ncbi:hypothetical protein CYMTET_40649 [Cymbomonas tetramitiformis]|uniref:holo-[acyl-carrier-protein] synthase n=1 Tax=Cymbomonas tetramitiformis TaxID=36881 RepID=A0AAE0C9P1_9CHLO|nr:hypothetical protein CYMTET_40649 [Cymbomonas tetramitiformis]
MIRTHFASPISFRVALLSHPSRQQNLLPRQVFPLANDSIENKNWDPTFHKRRHGYWDLALRRRISKQTRLPQEYLDILSNEERVALLSTENEEVRKEKLLARVLARTTLARYFNESVGPRDLCFHRTPAGKPEVSHVNGQAVELSQRIHFNLSHTDKLIACAVSQHSNIGVDVEGSTRKSKRGCVRLAQRWFSKEEAGSVASQPDDHRRARCFLRLWTLKEAVVKACGAGIAGMPFASFTARAAEPEGPQLQRVRQCLEQMTKLPVTSAALEIEIEQATQDMVIPRSSLLMLESSCGHLISICLQPAGDEHNITAPSRERFGITSLKTWWTIPLKKDRRTSGDLMVLGGTTSRTLPSKL